MKHGEFIKDYFTGIGRERDWERQGEREGDGEGEGEDFVEVDIDGVSIWSFLLVILTGFVIDFVFLEFIYIFFLLFS